MLFSRGFAQKRIFSQETPLYANSKSGLVKLAYGAAACQLLLWANLADLAYSHLREPLESQDNLPNITNSSNNNSNTSGNSTTSAVLQGANNPLESSKNTPATTTSVQSQPLASQWKRTLTAAGCLCVCAAFPIAVHLYASRRIQRIVSLDGTNIQIFSSVLIGPQSSRVRIVPRNRIVASEKYHPLGTIARPSMFLKVEGKTMVVDRLDGECPDPALFDFYFLNQHTRR